MRLSADAMGVSEAGSMHPWQISISLAGRSREVKYQLLGPETARQSTIRSKKPQVCLRKALSA
ncbi:MAG: hypothetical protein EOO61_04205 [Hymenobacter sp.]|nr:MAG: hypothetical protein EOO61_04205 [Hymenobacter sp.]